MMQWLRWYHGTATDLKFGRLARVTGQSRERVVFVWAMILECASDNDVRGECDLRADDISDVLNCETDAIQTIIDAMTDADLISEKSGIIHVISWEKRQPTSDDATARKRRQRERPKTVTGQSRDKGVTVTPPDTESETEKRDRARGARFTLTVLPPEWEEWARGEGFGSPQREFEVFGDYWRAQPGEKGVKTDWQAMWRNWIRRAKEDGRGGEVEAPTKPPRPDARLEWSGGDLPGLRQRLKSVTGSAWKVYLDRLVPTAPGITSGPEPPPRTMAEVHRLAEQFGVTVKGAE